MVQRQTTGTATDGDLLRVLRVTGDVGMCLQSEVEYLKKISSPDQVYSDYVNWPFSGHVPKLPVWVSLIVSLGTTIPELEFVGSSGIHQLHSPCSGSVLSTCMGSWRQLQSALQAACRMWVGICGWAGMQGGGSGSTTSSLTKSPFFLSTFAEKRLLSFWVLPSE